MSCPKCNRPIKPGTEISLRLDQSTVLHCPHCLYQMEAQPSDDPKTISVDRFQRRREARRAFIERLSAKRSDGNTCCPLCNRSLDANSLLLLQSSEHCRCPKCSRDLADVAYRERAYQEQPWLAVVNALADVKSLPRCVNCRYSGAAARSCQEALSWISKNHGKQSKLLATMVRHPDQHLPEDDCYETCPVVRQYREQIGDRLLLL